MIDPDMSIPEKDTPISSDHELNVYDANTKKRMYSKPQALTGLSSKQKTKRKKANNLAKKNRKRNRR